VLASDTDDYSKELYKLLKVFNNQYKKQLAMWDDRERERKKDFKRRSTVSFVGDPALAALRMSQAEALPPAAIGMCEKVIAQLNDFKVDSASLWQLSCLLICN